MKDKKSKILLLIGALVIVAFIVIGFVDFPNRGDNTEDTQVDTSGETDTDIDIDIETETETVSSEEDFVKEFFQNCIPNTDETLVWDRIDLPLDGLFDDGTYYKILDTAVVEDEIVILVKMRSEDSVQTEFAMVTYPLDSTENRGGILIPLEIPEHEWELYYLAGLSVGADDKIYAVLKPGSIMNFAIESSEFSLSENAYLISWNMDGSIDKQILVQSEMSTQAGELKVNSKGEVFCLDSFKLLQIMEDGTVNQVTEFSNGFSVKACSTSYYAKVSDVKFWGTSPDAKVQLYNIETGEMLEEKSTVYYVGNIDIHYWVEDAAYFMLPRQLYYYNLDNKTYSLVYDFAHTDVIVGEVIPVDDNTLIVEYQLLDEEALSTHMVSILNLQ